MFLNRPVKIGFDIRREVFKHGGIFLAVIDDKAQFVDGRQSPIIRAAVKFGVQIGYVLFGIFQSVILCRRFFIGNARFHIPDIFVDFAVRNCAAGKINVDNSAFGTVNFFLTVRRHLKIILGTCAIPDEPISKRNRFFAVISVVTEIEIDNPNISILEQIGRYVLQNRRLQLVMLEEVIKIPAVILVALIKNGA